MVYLTWSFPLLTGSSALLFHSLSFPLLSLSFVFCSLWSFWSFPLLPGSSALLFHSLSVPLLSLSFVSCFLFLFPVVVLCLFNPFSLSILFHFIPFLSSQPLLFLYVSLCFSMFLYVSLCSSMLLYVSLCYSMLLYVTLCYSILSALLCSALLCSALFFLSLSLSPSSTLLFFLLVFYSRLPGCRVAGLPGCRVAGLPGRRCRVKNVVG